MTFLSQKLIRDGVRTMPLAPNMLLFPLPHITFLLFYHHTEGRSEIKVYFGESKWPFSWPVELYKMEGKRKNKNRAIIELSTGYSIKGKSNHVSKIVHMYN